MHRVRLHVAYHLDCTVISGLTERLKVKVKVKVKVKSQKSKVEVKAKVKVEVKALSLELEKLPDKSRLYHQ